MTRIKQGQTVRAIRFRGEDVFHICVRDDANRPICGHTPQRWVVSNASSDVYIDENVATMTIDGRVCEGCAFEARNIYGFAFDQDSFKKMLPLQLWYIEVWEREEGSRSFVVKAHTTEDALDKLRNGGVDFERTMTEETLEDHIDGLLNKNGWLDMNHLR